MTPPQLEEGKKAGFFNNMTSRTAEGVIKTQDHTVLIAVARQFPLKKTCEPYSWRETGKFPWKGLEGALTAGHFKALQSKASYPAEAPNPLGEGDQDTRASSYLLESGALHHPALLLLIQELVLAHLLRLNYPPSLSTP